MRLTALVYEVIALGDGGRNRHLLFALAPDICIKALVGSGRFEKTFIKLKIVSHREDKILLPIIRGRGLWLKEIKIHKLIATRKISKGKTLCVPLAEYPIQLREVALRFSFRLVRGKRKSAHRLFGKQV